MSKADIIFRDLMYDLIIESLVDKLENYEITMEDAEIFSEAVYDELFYEAKNKGEFGFFGQKYYNKHKADYARDLDPQINTLKMRLQNSKNPEEQRMIMKQLDAVHHAQSNLFDSQGYINDKVRKKAYEIDGYADLGKAALQGAAIGGAGLLAKHIYDKKKRGRQLLEEARSMTPKQLNDKISIFASDPKQFKQELAIFKKVLTEKQQGR